MSHPFLVSSRYTRMYDVRLALVLGSSTAALLINQIHYHIEWRDREGFKLIEDRQWWRSSMSEWVKEFPDLSESTIRREIKDCYQKGVILIRRERSALGIESVWYSLDYEKISELAKASPSVNLTSPPPCQTDGHPPVKLTGTPCQTDRHLKEHSTKAKSSQIAEDPEAQSASGTVKKKDTLEERQEKARRQNFEKFKERFEKSGSVASVEKLWEFITVEERGRKGFVPFTPMTRKKTKPLIKFCEDAGIDLPEFINWCVLNWDSLRDFRMTWAKLGPNPNYQTICDLRDRFLEQMRKNGGGDKEGKTSGRTVTSIDQVPKDHPHFESIRKVLERGGKVTLS